ncbi:hypothetical protein GCM10009753_69110 [Streptantibioticus ferralitis]
MANLVDGEGHDRLRGTGGDFASTQGFSGIMRSRTAVRKTARTVFNTVRAVPGGMRPLRDPDASEDE